jgi:hypothetical protein
MKNPPAPPPGFVIEGQQRQDTAPPAPPPGFVIEQTQPVERQPAQPEQSDGNFIERAGGTLARAATGFGQALTGNDAPFKGTPEVQSRTPREGDPRNSSTRVGVGFTLSNDDAQRVAILRNNFPEASFRTDQSLAQEQGIDWPEDRVPRPMVQVRPDEEFRFINAPGFSTQDALDIGTGVVAFGRAAAFQAGGRTVVGRMARGGLAAGLTQAAMDQGATAFGADRGADPIRTGVAALSAAGAEPLVSLGGALLRRGTNARRSAAGPLDEQGAATLNANSAMTPVESATGGARSAAPGAATPNASETARRSLADEFDVPLTRGQQAREPDMIRREMQMTRGAMGPEARNEVRPFLQNQVESVEAAARRFGGPDMPATPNRSQLLGETGDRVRDTVRSGADDLWRQIDDAYTAAGQMDAQFTAEGVRDLPDFARQWVSSRDFLIPDTVALPSATAAMGRLTALVDEMAALEAGGEVVSTVSLRRIEQARRQINIMGEAALNNADRRAAGEVRQALDAWTDRAVDQALISGDEGALEALRSARGLRRRYATVYSEGRGARHRSGTAQPDPAGRIIERIVEDDLSGTEVVNLLIGRSQLGAQRGTARAVERLVTELGPDSPEIGAIRQAYVARLLRNLPTTEQPGIYGRRLAKDWLEATTGSGAEMTRALFTRSERAQMTRYNRLLQELTAPDNATQTSGTAENIATLLRDATTNFLDRIPVAGRLVRQVTTGMDDGGRAMGRAAITAERPALAGPVSRAARAAGASSGGILEGRGNGTSQPPR